MLAMVSVPAALTLKTVRSPGTLQIASSNPTPYGYTWSLLLFVIPIMVIAFGFLPRQEANFPRKAFWWTIGILVPLGFATDFFFASRFFIFSNAGATLQIGAPALHKPVPIEEYVFYLAGFMATLLIYLWLDEYWLAAYNAPDYRMEPHCGGSHLQKDTVADPRRFPRVFHFPCARCFCSSGQLFSNRQAIH